MDKLELARKLFLDLERRKTSPSRVALRNFSIISKLKSKEKVLNFRD